MKTLLILATMAISIFGFAGGGGSSSGNSSSSGSSSSSSSGSSSSYSSSSSHSGHSNGNVNFLPLAIIIIIIFILLSILSYRETKKKLPANDHNKTEQEKWIHEEAKRIFVQYQQDWSDYNLKNIQQYTTDRYFQHASLMLEAIDKTRRRNVVSNLSVRKTILFTPVNSESDLPKTVQIVFEFNGTDKLIDTKTGHVFYEDDALGVIEYWNFVYDGKSLKLDGITQSTESTPHLIRDIADFAESAKLFYSPDWGRLALPAEGLIFDEETLVCSDVNNHVVGKWKDCLIQMYTYSASPGRPESYYLVGQINVPKSYEGVIVEAEKANLKTTKPKDYEEFSMEWEDFNKHYKVYASSKDALPAFELLNPVFMEKLYKRNLPYNLEVKDNTIYIFARVTEANKESYAEMLDVLTEAFNELKI